MVGRLVEYAGMPALFAKMINPAVADMRHKNAPAMEADKGQGCTHFSLSTRGIFPVELQAGIVQRLPENRFIEGVHVGCSETGGKTVTYNPAGYFAFFPASQTIAYKKKSVPHGRFSLFGEDTVFVMSAPACFVQSKRRIENDLHKNLI
jgi:hypothetical protein